ncbi:hypothetical protein CY652_06645 [Burkholderia sp. WAC0059]|uniref:hypothetical protein n=1 Tax=Burkholderia sp. WAC0059 TaxID=2066022 RepID=UPI000C7F2594|nr:hypothetical protein [Burkholderia sp. WAC0059]PLZ03478.1 hypothetical protein CY652_06645 [Burkholderia sp. WAC0059]
MLRWLIALLILANLLALATIYGAFGPLPAAGSRETWHMSRQFHPERLAVRGLAAPESVDPAVVGGPAPSPPIQASSLAP